MIDSTAGEVCRSASPRNQQIMQAIGLLTETPQPTDDDISEVMAGNACRCATYHRIRAAIHVAAKKLEA